MIGPRKCKRKGEKVTEDIKDGGEEKGGLYENNGRSQGKEREYCEGEEGIKKHRI